jgi:peroxiredoxin
MTFRLIRIVLAGAVSVCLVACNQPTSVAEAPVLESGYWQATITLPGAEIETGLEISNDGDLYQASLVNGQERVRISEVSFTNNELVLRFPGFNNEIRAVLADDKLSGELTIVRRYGETQVMPFTATPGGERSLESNESPRHDMSGRWAVKFHEPDGTDTLSIGEFAQRGSRLFGTFLNPNGDHRFLAGNVRGNRFKLSTFDGAHAFVFSGELNQAGEIVDADFWSSTSWHQKWSGVRNDSVVLPDAYNRTFLKPGYDRFDFEFPDLDGNLVSLGDEKYQGKVVLVTIAGTWCPNCNDEARYLAPFYKQYRDQGLEIVALLYEHFEDADLAAEQVRQFRAKFAIEYDTLVAGVSDKTEAGNTLPALSAVLAYPTTIFIDRDGRVRKIHTGFTGPGTGVHYTRLQEEFTDLVTTMLAEPANLIDTLTTEETVSLPE